MIEDSIQTCIALSVEQDKSEPLCEIVQRIFFPELFAGSIGINRINAVNHGWNIHAISEYTSRERYPRTQEPKGSSSSADDERLPALN